MVCIDGSSEENTSPGLDNAWVASSWAVCGWKDVGAEMNLGASVCCVWACCRLLLFLIQIIIWQMRLWGAAEDCLYFRISLKQSLSRRPQPHIPVKIASAVAAAAGHLGHSQRLDLTWRCGRGWTAPIGEAQHVAQNNYILVCAGFLRQQRDMGEGAAKTGQHTHVRNFTNRLGEPSAGSKMYASLACLVIFLRGKFLAVS